LEQTLKTAAPETKTDFIWQAVQQAGTWTAFTNSLLSNCKKTDFNSYGKEVHRTKFGQMGWFL
jgi:hypothetical protein